MSTISAGYSVICDICEAQCSWESTRSMARESAKRLGWFRKRGPQGGMIDVCFDCHYQQVVERQLAAEQSEVQP